MRVEAFLSGPGTNYPPYDYQNSYDEINRLTQMLDNTNYPLTPYTATVTSDFNGNITRVVEAGGSQQNPANATTDFEWDYDNRLLSHTIPAAGAPAHSYDGFGRRVKTNAGGTNYHHVFDGSQHLRSYTALANGDYWVNSIAEGKAQVTRSLQTTANTTYNLDDHDTSNRKTLDITNNNAVDNTEFDSISHLDLINGALPPYRLQVNNSYLFKARNIITDPHNVLMPVERQSYEYAAANLLYEHNRIKHPLLGRDLNPMGRGDSAYYVGGNVGFFGVYPFGLIATGGGNSINNQLQSDNCWELDPKTGTPRMKCECLWKTEECALLCEYILQWHGHIDCCPAPITEKDGCKSIQCLCGDPLYECDPSGAKHGGSPYCVPGPCCDPTYTELHNACVKSMHPGATPECCGFCPPEKGHTAPRIQPCNGNGGGGGGNGGGGSGGGSFGSVRKAKSRNGLSLFSRYGNYTTSIAHQYLYPARLPGHWWNPCCWIGLRWCCPPPKPPKPEKPRVGKEISFCSWAIPDFIKQKGPIDDCEAACAIGCTVCRVGFQIEVPYVPPSSLNTESGCNCYCAAWCQNNEPDDDIEACRIGCEQCRLGLWKC